MWQFANAIAMVPQIAKSNRNDSRQFVRAIAQMARLAKAIAMISQIAKATAMILQFTQAIAMTW